MTEFAPILEDIPDDLLRDLQEQGFFVTFARMATLAETVPVIHTILFLLRFFSTYPTSVCLQMLSEGVASFLKRQIFSTNKENQILALNCVETFAQDSNETRHLFCLLNFVPDLASIGISSIDRDSAELASHIISHLCSCDYASRDVQIILRVVMALLNRDIVRWAPRMLVFVAETLDKPMDVFASPQFCAAFISLISGHRESSEFLSFCLKFLLIRADYEKEVVAMFRSGILEKIREFLDGNARITSWVFWVAGNIVKQIPESIEKFFDLGFFDVMEDLILNGNFEARPAAVVALCRLVWWKRDWNFLASERVVRMIEESCGILDSGSERTRERVLEMLVVVLEVEMTVNGEVYVEVLREKGVFDFVRDYICEMNNNSAILAGKLLQLGDVRDWE
jgi:hypothetical protein